MTDPARYTAADIEAVTDGAVNSNRLGVWIHRKVLRTELQEPRAGKPRLFTFVTVFECALISEFHQSGVPLDRAAVSAHNVLGLWARGTRIAILFWDAAGKSMRLITEDEINAHETTIRDLVKMLAQDLGQTPFALSVLVPSLLYDAVKQKLEARIAQREKRAETPAETRLDARA